MVRRFAESYRTRLVQRQNRNKTPPQFSLEQDGHSGVWHTIAAAMSVTVRLMQPGDALRSLEIHRAAIRGIAAKDYSTDVIDAWAPLPITDTNIERLLANPDNVIRLMAEVDGEAVGIGALLLSTSQLRGCFVAPHAARRGVGSAIVAEIERVAREHELTYLQVESSLTAEPFYAALGYHVEGPGIDANVPRHFDVHLIMDNYSTHNTALIRNWFAKRPRFHVHYTPTYGSWLSLVERWFAELTTKQIRRGAYHSVAQLKAGIQEFIDAHQADPKPFVWTKSADEILATKSALSVFTAARNRECKHESVEHLLA